ncbi:MAG: hypothetical protein ACRD44_15090 [Bryobacteraceae bacterium]
MHRWRDDLPWYVQVVVWIGGHAYWCDECEADLVTFRKRKHRLVSGKKRPKPHLEHAEQA